MFIANSEHFYRFNVFQGDVMKLFAMNIELVLSEPWIVCGTWIMKGVNRNEQK